MKIQEIKHEDGWVHIRFADGYPNPGDVGLGVAYNGIDALNMAIEQLEELIKQREHLLVMREILKEDPQLKNQKGEVEIAVSVEAVKVDGNSL